MFAWPELSCGRFRWFGRTCLSDLSIGGPTADIWELKPKSSSETGSSLATDLGKASEHPSSLPDHSGLHQSVIEEIWNHLGTSGLMKLTSGFSFSSSSVHSSSSVGIKIDVTQKWQMFWDLAVTAGCRRGHVGWRGGSYGGGKSCA